MKHTRIVIGIVGSLVILGVATAFRYTQTPSPEPSLIGDSPVRSEDLPEIWQGLTDAELRVAVDNLISAGLEGRESWRGSPFTQDEGRQIRLAALLLGDDQLGVRSLCWLANRLRSDDQEELAIEYLDAAIAEAVQAGLNDELAQCHFQRGRCLDWLDLHEWSLSAYTKALEITRELEDPTRESYYLMQLANVNYHRLMRYEDAELLFAQLPEIAGRGVEPGRMIPMYSLWGLSLQSYGRYHDALDPFLLALDAAEETGEVDRIHRVLKLLAGINLELNRVTESEVLLQRAIDLEPVPERCSDWFDPHRTLAAIYVLTDREEEAEILLADTLERIGAVEASASGTDQEGYVLEQMRSEMVKTLAALGGLYSLREEPDLALKFYLEADKLNENAGMVFPHEDMTTAIAETYLQLGQLVEAETWLAKAGDNELLNFMPDADRGDPEVLRRLGEIQLEQGNLQQAEEYLQSALSACIPVRVQGIVSQKSKVLLAMGRLAEQQSDKVAAEVQFQLAFDELLATAREFPWNTLLKTTLTDDINEAGQQLIEVLESQGKQIEAEGIRTTLGKVHKAQVFAKEHESLSNDSAEQVLRSYRNTTTYIHTLRYALYWQLGVGMQDFDERMVEIISNSDLKPQYRNELVRQIEDSRTEVREKLLRLELEADQLLAELRQLDPETAAVIELR